MNDAELERAANLLVRARSTSTRIDPPGILADEAEAYAIQDQTARQLGPVGGWKVGAKSSQAVPTCAPLPLSRLYASPATLPAAGYEMIGVEAELAFRLGRDLPAGGADLPPSAILDSVGSVHVAIEIVDTRLRDWQTCDRLWLLADSQMNAGLVYGDPCPEWRQADLAGAPVRLAINGHLVSESRGGNPGGDPRRLLAWLVNHVRQQRGGLRTGCLITTGSYTGMVFVEPDSVVRVEFPGLGEAAVSFPSPP